MNSMPGVVPSLGELGLEVPPPSTVRCSPRRASRPPGGGSSDWLERGVDGYASSRDRLDLEDGTSRLSADLHFGLLSPNEIAERALGPGDGRRVFVNELVWREFYAHVLFHRPSVRERSFRPEFDGIAWSRDEGAIHAWQTGRTGYPIVDAAMRQLAATGWMHNRARMIVATFLTKDLLVDWRVGEAHFMRHLVDGDIASNNGGWQWSASTGTDPQPYFRIFSPVAQGRRHDPDGAIRPTLGAGIGSRSDALDPCALGDAARGGRCRRRSDRHRLPGAHRGPRDGQAPGARGLPERPAESRSPGD